MTVQQLFDKILTRLGAAPPQTVSFLDAVNDVLEIVGNVLLDCRSDMLRRYGSVTYTTGVSTANLPVSFWGFIGLPYTSDVTDGTKELAPLVNAMEYDNATNGKPEQFELQQSNGVDVLRVYPSPDASYTVKFAYNLRPSVTAMTDSLPFGGLFDMAIADILIRVGNSGGWGAITNETLVIEDKIRSVLRNRTPRRLKAPNIRALWA